MLKSQIEFDWMKPEENPWIFNSMIRLFNFFIYIGNVCNSTHCCKNYGAETGPTNECGWVKSLKFIHTYEQFDTMPQTISFGTRKIGSYNLCLSFLLLLLSPDDASRYRSLFDSHSIHVRHLQSTHKLDHNFDLQSKTPYKFSHFTNLLHSNLFSLGMQAILTTTNNNEILQHQATSCYYHYIIRWEFQSICSKYERNYSKNSAKEYQFKAWNSIKNPDRSVRAGIFVIF